MIEGIQITPLKQITDDRGKVMHMLKTDDPSFEEFGGIHFSVVNPGAVKPGDYTKKSPATLQ
ncbi:MAG: hypothetical protein CMH70_05765 [Nitrosomonadaceae bacterium]|nr:hypothetical protein [Nitrosomonadaceae bacterium]